MNQEPSAIWSDYLATELHSLHETVQEEFAVR
jgi:hypothetical protein